MEAHANLAGSEPAAGEVVPSSPTEIRLEFTETTEPDFTSARLFNAAGEMVMESPLTPVGGDDLLLSFSPPPLENGTYTVVWRNVSSVDGHPRNGSFTFHVGERSQGDVAPVDIGDAGGPPKALSVFSRWFTFASHVLLVGIAACAAFVLIPALRQTGSPSDLWTTLGRRLSRLWWGALVAAITAAVVALVMQAWRSAGGFSDGLDAIDGLVSDTRFGRFWLARIVLLGVIAYASLLLERRLFRQPVMPAWLLAFGGSLGLVATISLVSHAAASSDDMREAGTFADFVHTAGAGIWIGGLVTLGTATTLFMQRENAAALLRVAVPRFSALALGTVVAIALTGVVQWYLRVGNLADTANSGYGQSLIAKTLLLLPMLGLAAFNLLLLRPQLQDAARGTALTVGRFLRRNVAGEALLGLLILLATAFLTDTSPPDSSQVEARDAIEQEVRQGDLELDLTIEPGATGSNDLELVLDDREGPEEEVRNVIVRLRYLDEDFGQSEEEVVERGEGVYGVTDAQFGLAGNWEVLVIVQRTGVRDVTTNFEVQIE